MIAKFEPKSFLHLVFTLKYFSFDDILEDCDFYH
jgi:hypothetical protein